jgi:hypothetical protein
MEYGFLIQTCDLPADLDSLSSQERTQLVAQRMAESAELLQNSVRSLDDGGWTVVSHNVMRMDSALILSFLITREQRSAQDQINGGREVVRH